MSVCAHMCRCADVCVCSRVCECEFGYVQVCMPLHSALGRAVGQDHNQ